MSFPDRAIVLQSDDRRKFAHAILRVVARELATTTIEDPKGLIGVEFSFTNGRSNTEFDPRNAESALVTMVPLSGQSCYGPTSGITLLPSLRPTKAGSSS
jgi:hypothetical protein